jgi:hypothetical protein
LLDRRCSLERLAGFFACLLQAECVGRLRVELNSAFQFLGLAAEKGETTARRLRCLLRLECPLAMM